MKDIENIRPQFIKEKIEEFKQFSEKILTEVREFMIDDRQSFSGQFGMIKTKRDTERFLRQLILYASALIMNRIYIDLYVFYPHLHERDDLYIFHELQQMHLLNCKA